MVPAHWNNSPQVDMSLHSYISCWFWTNQSLLLLLNVACLGLKKICVCLLSKKSRVGRSVLLLLLLFFFFFNYRQNGNSRAQFRYSIFEISGKPSFVLWRVTQFFYLLCSQFRQKTSGWINKTLLLIKQHKWLSKFCVKIDRVVSKN